jgi:hypothetical protein
MGDPDSTYPIINKKNSNGLNNKSPKNEKNNTKMKKIQKIILILGILFCLFACNERKVNKKEAIIGSWLLDKIDVEHYDKKDKNDTLKNEQPNKKAFNIMLDIRKDGSYLWKRGKIASDSGQWRLSTDDKVIVFESKVNPKDNADFWFENVEYHQFSVYTKEQGRKETITFIAK